MWGILIIIYNIGDDEREYAHLGSKEREWLL